jgi:hypothetical protein
MVRSLRSLSTGASWAHGVEQVLFAVFAVSVPVGNHVSTDVR